jgi:hypothetical protein
VPCLCIAIEARWLKYAIATAAKPNARTNFMMRQPWYRPVSRSISRLFGGSTKERRQRRLNVRMRHPAR